MYSSSKHFHAHRSPAGQLLLPCAPAHGLVGQWMQQLALTQHEDTIEIRDDKQLNRLTQYQLPVLLVMPTGTTQQQICANMRSNNTQMQG